MSVVWRAALAVVVVAVVGCAILGIGMGEAPAQRERAPSAAQVAAARQRIATAGAEVRRGRALFTQEGCDRCHSIASIGAGGKLGPRLDTLDEDLEHNLESIAEPRKEITEGYPEQLMPDFGGRLDARELHALAAFVTTAAGGKREGGGGEGGHGKGGEDGGSGKGRGRNRGRGGSSG
ncbi:MAG: Cytochrome c [bacterium]